jgi:hypothetical protein
MSTRRAQPSTLLYVLLSFLLLHPSYPDAAGILGPVAPHELYRRIHAPAPAERRPLSGVAAEAGCGKEARSRARVSAKAPSFRRSRRMNERP